MEISDEELAELIRQRDELIACLGRASEYLRALRLINVGLYVQIPEHSALARDCMASGRQINEAMDWLEQIHNEAKRRYQSQDAEPAPVKPAPEETRVLH